MQWQAQNGWWHWFYAWRRITNYGALGSLLGGGRNSSGGGIGSLQFQD
jgi:hypothetical protein